VPSSRPPSAADKHYSLGLAFHSPCRSTRFKCAVQHHTRCNASARP
jgi:hypothetical protein